MSGTYPSSRRRRFRRGPRPLQHPVFRRVLGVSVAGHFVRFIDFTITAWLVVQLTDSSSAVGLLVFFRVIPFLLFGSFVGLAGAVLCGGRRWAVGGTVCGGIISAVLFVNYVVIPAVQ